MARVRRTGRRVGRPRPRHAGDPRGGRLLGRVLELPAAQVAVMLDTTTASVKSALQRARARLEEVAPAADQITEPDIPQARALLDEYITAFENADAAAIERLL